jgi:hypothetical protein
MISLCYGQSPGSSIRGEMAETSVKPHAPWGQRWRHFETNNSASGLGKQIPCFGEAFPYYLFVSEQRRMPET